MSANRERLTWAAGRKASAPPATPGYETEDQDHPAHQADPGAHDYENGDTSSWAEDPKTPPYPQGNPPATPGYDTEDQDHPAHENPPRVPKEASLREQIKQKAAKCLRVARLMLGEGCPDESVEDQALDLMDLPDDQLMATLNRVSGNGLVAEVSPVNDGPVSEEEIDALLAGDAAEPVQDDAMGALSCKLAELSKEIEILKAASQNAPGGSQNGANAPGKTEEQVRAEGAATAEKQEVKTAARKFFASMDTDGDGFVLRAEWLGNPAIFTAADKDKDDIVSEDEVVDELTGKEEKEEKKAGEVPEAFKAQWDKNKKDDGDKKDDKKPDFLKDKDDKKASDDADEDDKGVVEDEKEEKKASDDADEDDAPVEDEKEEKKACGEAVADEIDDAAMFGLTDDPMGLGESPVTTPEEEALLASVFGKAAKDDEEVVEEEVEEKTDKKASRTASQKPQPRKPSVGPKTIGSQVRTAGQRDEVGELSRLWESAPDVSDVFGMK